MREVPGIGLWSRLAAIAAAVAMTSGFALAQTKAAPAKPAEPKQAAEKTTHAPAAKVDINAASKAELEKLPGIGDAYSQKIIDGRPYKAKNELESKNILPKSVYDKIGPMIIAHQK